MNESELVKACLKGKRDSQKQLYEHFAPKMLGVCYRYAHSREEAEDFLQDAFITIFRKLHQWEKRGELGAWIRRIVINTALNGIKARHPFNDSQGGLPIEQISDTMEVVHPFREKELIELIHQLPTGYKAVFNLYAIEGYSHEEIGTLLGIKAATSRSQYMKARNMLLQKLSAEHKISNDASRTGRFEQGV